MIAERETQALCCGQRWLLHLFEETPDMARPVQRTYRLNSAFDPSAFLEAFQSIVASHPALRLRLRHSKSGWKQHFPEQKASISWEEIKGQTAKMRAAYAGMLLTEESKIPLDLRKESPVKAKVIKVDGEYLLSLCIDHLAADELAFDLFEQALSNAYAGTGESPGAPTASETFFDFLRREFEQQSSEQQNLIYWKELLKNSPPSKKGSDALQWVPATITDYEVTGADFQELQQFCRMQKCSVFHVVIACQLLILAKAGELDELILNIPVSNRIRAQERTIIANLSMLLHLRFSIQTNEPAAALVIRVRDQLLKAMVHRQYDYARLSEFLAEDAEKRNITSNWLVGCNFITGSNHTAFPNSLFEERLDNRADRTFDIPGTSFTLSAHQTETGLRLGIEWDETTWKLSKEDMNTTLSVILRQFIDSGK